MEQRKVFEVFLISTQWILSWLDNNHLIMNWRLSGKDVILSVLIKSFDVFSLTSFYVMLCCSLATAIDHSYKIHERTEEFLYGHIWILNTNCDSVKDCKHFLININNFVFLLENHQLIIDWFLSDKTWNFEYWQKTLEVFNSLCHGVCHNFPRLKRVSITLIWCQQ